jgi:deoxyribose-phosphate aldolase
LFKKGGRWYADWRDAAGVRKRKAFGTAAAARDYERRQKQYAGTEDRMRPAPVHVTIAAAQFAAELNSTANRSSNAPSNPPSNPMTSRLATPVIVPRPEASAPRALASIAAGAIQPNRGTSLNFDWVADVRVNTSAVERRAATVGTRRTVKKEWQAAWLLRAITCMDLTTLSGDDTHERVRRLCAKARRPLQESLVRALKIEELDIKVGAVCVYHYFVETAVRALEGSGIPVAAVSTGFPAGLSPLSERVAEIRRSAEAGAREIDVVITRAHVFDRAWTALYDEVATFKEACGAAHMKVILGTGDLLTLRNVARASVVAMMAGADFIKTSTGKESVNATLPVSLVMVRAIREYARHTGYAVGFKPAGGLRTAKQAMEWLILMKEELGRPWLSNQLFRFGASGMLADIERQLEHFVTGRYSAEYRHPIA